MVAVAQRYLKRKTHFTSFVYLIYLFTKRCFLKFVAPADNLGDILKAEYLY